MGDIDKARAQRDALRKVTSRRTSRSPRAEQAIVRHLDVELYEARRRRAGGTPEDPDKEQTTGKS